MRYLPFRSHAGAVLPWWPVVGAGPLVIGGDLLSAGAVVVSVVHVGIGCIRGVVSKYAHIRLLCLRFAARFGNLKRRERCRHLNDERLHSCAFCAVRVSDASFSPLFGVPNPARFVSKR